MAILRAFPIASLLLCLVVPVQAQNAGIPDQPTYFVEMQVAQLQQKKAIGGGVNVGPLRTVKELSAEECQKLGCTVVIDKTCPKIPADVIEKGKFTKLRCSCPGGKSLCIDKGV